MSYSYYLEIAAKATAIGSDESDFPVILALTHSMLATTANGGCIQNTDASGGASGSLTVPADFVVGPNADGSSPYDFEVIAYTPTTGYILLALKISSLSSSSNNTVFLAFGDSGVTASQENVTGTWSDNFAGVYHLGEGGGTAYDSSPNGNHATDHASATGTTGKVGSGQELDGSDDYYEVADGGDLDFPGADFTIMAWVYEETRDSSWMDVICGKADATRQEGYVLGIAGNNDGGNTGKLRLFNNENPLDEYSNGTVSLSTWTHIACVYDDSANEVDFYLGGSHDGTQAGAGEILSASTNFRIGIDPRDAAGYAFDGFLDELWISSVERDADWIGTAHANQNAHAPDSTFWTAVGVHVVAGDTVSLTEALQPVRAITHTAGDTLTISDDFDTMFCRIRVANDTVSLTEGTLRPRVMNRFANETEALPEGLGNDTYTYLNPTNPDLRADMTAKEARASMNKKTVRAT